MATSTEHKELAEKWLREAEMISDMFPENKRYCVQVAQVHATLATVPDPVQVMSVEDWNKTQQKD